MKDFSNLKFNAQDKINYDGENLFDMGLENNPEAFTVMIDDVEYKAVIHSKSSSQRLYDDERYMLLKGKGVKKGSVVEHDGKTWITHKFPEYNGIYSKTEIRLSNYFFTFKTESEMVQIGEDWRGNPIYEDVSSEELTVPSITDTISRFADSGDPINLPDGTYWITIPYKYRKYFKIGDTIDLYDMKFKVNDIDYTQLIEDEGFIRLYARYEEG